MRRRDFLFGGAATLLAGCNVQAPHEGFFGKMESLNEGMERALFRRGSTGAATRVSDLTPKEAFPIYKLGAALPGVPAGWGLEVSGMVQHPVRLSLAELRRLPRTDMRVRHHCVEGWSAVASWHGVRLSEVAKAVGLDPRAPYVDFVSFEPVPDSEEDETYTSGWDRESALHPQTLLAYGMNGEPLGAEHGGPVRLYASTKLGYKMVKWLSAVRFVPQKTGGYWEDQGYGWFGGV